MSLYAVKNDKGEWWDFEAYDGFWSDGSCECAVTAYQGTADSVVKEHGGHVVKLIEEQKVKLPCEVGEELDEYKRGFEHDIDVLDLLTDVDDSSELLKMHKWLYNSDGYRSERANRLIDAYRYGWEAEKETLYNVKVPHTKDVWYYKAWNSDLRTISDKELRSEFTESEIEHYGLQDCEKEEVTD